MNSENKFFRSLLLTGLLLTSTIQATAQTDSVKVEITEGTNISAALSPDKQSIVIDLQGTIWLIPASGGDAKQLTDVYGDSRVPAWAPDGKSIVFQSYRDGNYHLWVVQKDGSGLKQLTNGLYDDREPFWSPDGKSIVFSSDRAGNYDICKLDIASSAIIQLTKDESNDNFPSYSADGSKIAFVSERKASPGIYVLDSHGKEKLFVKALGKLDSPVWSADGSRIIFNSFFQGKSTLDVAGDGKWEAISDEKEDVFPFRISWISATEFLYTSDGKIKKRSIEDKETTSIPFKASINLGRHTYKKKVHNFDASAPRKVKGIREPVVSPPDGKNVAFTALGDLWIVAKGNSKPTRLTNDEYLEIGPVWSPDGKTLAYTSDKNGNLDLWLRDIATGKERVLLDLPESISHPAWSADGKKIAFLNDQPGGKRGFELKVLSISDGITDSVYETPLDISAPSWSADGKFLVTSALKPYSSRYREGISQFLFIPLDKSPAHFTTPHPDFSLATRGKNGPVWSPDGNHIAYVLDGLLWYVNVGNDGKLSSQPKRLTNELAESLSWTGDSKSIVYIGVDTLKQVRLADGSVEKFNIDLSWANKVPTEEYVIPAGKLFDGKTESYRENVDILIKGNRIKEIQNHQNGRNGKVIDASKNTVIPGLFELHTHLSDNAGEELGRLWLSYAVTSIREPGTNPYDALERKESWASGRRVGPRSFTTGGLLDGSRIYYGGGVSNPSGAKLDLELNRVARLDFDFVKTYVRLSDYQQQRVTLFAHKLGIPVTSHEIFPSSFYGVDGIEHIAATSRRGFSPKITSTKKSYQDVTEIITKSGINLTPTASLHGGYYKLADVDPDFFTHRQFSAFYKEDLKKQIAEVTQARFKPVDPDHAQFGNIQKTLKTIIDNGGRITPGTDSPLIAAGISYHAELQSWVDGGISPFQTLRAASLWSAEAVGAGKDLGSIINGKLADLVIVEGDPLKNIKDVLNVKTVIKNGEIHSIDQLLKRP